MILRREAQATPNGRSFLHSSEFLFMKKCAKYPSMRIYLFLKPTIMELSSLIETFYFTEDILSRQGLVITEQIHNLSNGQANVSLDLGQPKDIE